MRNSGDSKQGHKGISGRFGRCVWVEFHPRIGAIRAWVKGKVHCIGISARYRIEKCKNEEIQSKLILSFCSRLLNPNTDMGERIHHYPIRQF